jgi:hypothetical protein
MATDSDGVAVLPCLREMASMFVHGDGSTYSGETAHRLVEQRVGDEEGEGAVSEAPEAMVLVMQGEGSFSTSGGSSVLSAGVRSYEGGWKNDRPHGRGLMLFANGDVYTGMWANGVFHGAGTYAFADGREYSGLWSDGRMHGQGTLCDENGIKWRGEFRGGRAEQLRIAFS